MYLICTYVCNIFVIYFHNRFYLFISRHVLIYLFGFFLIIILCFFFIYYFYILAYMPMLEDDDDGLQIGPMRLENWVRHIFAVSLLCQNEIGYFQRLQTYFLIFFL